LGFALIDSPKEALDVYQNGLRLAPDNYTFQLNAGFCLRQLNRLSEALAALERAATLDSAGAADALVQAGLVANRMTRYTKAEGLFRDAIRRAPNAPAVGDTWGYLARSLYGQERYHEAVDAWDRAERLSPRGFIDEGGDRSRYEGSRAGAPR
jgi:tetratricopeptide (TPR) repeat protein